MHGRMSWTIVWASLFCVGAAMATDGKRAEDWVQPMRLVHARFHGRPGAFAEFGDSITVSLAFWSPLRWTMQGADEPTQQAIRLVRGYMRPECWDRWKGPAYGNEGGMTIRWADENVDRWLKRLDPEVAVVMFGTNDLGQLELKEYEQKTRHVVERCLKHGTVVILTTIPPRSGMAKKASAFASAVRRIARQVHVPLIDYQHAILKRQPNDWDGSKIRPQPTNPYDVPSLISADGVHPSNPKAWSDFSKQSLEHNGFNLRTDLTVRAYADVIRQVLSRRD